MEPEINMFQYKISIDKKIIAILGPHLYGDTASILAELISNCHDADADNCWVTLKTGDNPEIIIEDDGHGMTPEEVNKYFLDIGYDRRLERPKTPGGRNVYGRKGIGKLAAFSLGKRIELYSLKDGKKAGCILDYDEITQKGKEPETIPDKDIKFIPDRLKNGTGTRLVLKDIQKNINNTYYYLINRILRNFYVDLSKFKIHIAKNGEAFRVINNAELNYFEKMDTILTIGSNFKKTGDLVQKNAIEDKYKSVYHFESKTKENERFGIEIPRKIEVITKSGTKQKVDFTYSGWVGTIINKENLKSLVIKDGASPDEEKSISINDNRITIFSRDRIGEYDVLPKVQTDTIYDAYIVGEIHADIFEDDNLVDMAISNRRGYEETDGRYIALISDLKSAVRSLVTRRAEINKARNEDEDKKKSDEIKAEFQNKTQTIQILRTKLDEGEQKVVEGENFQFLRAVKLAKNTKKILISHNTKNKEYGFFIMRLFEILGVDIPSTFMFTSYGPTSAPHGVDIYDYLKGAFRDDMYVVFLFSKHFYDSNMSIAETGAAWATNTNHSLIVIDIDYGDVDRPINNALNGLTIGDLTQLNRPETKKFIQKVFSYIGIPAPTEEKILEAIETVIGEFTGKLSTMSYFPTRKYQGCPICDKSGCGNVMKLKSNDAGEIFYECSTPGCGNKINASIR